MGVPGNNVPGYLCGYTFLKFAMIIVYFLSGLVLWNIFWKINRIVFLYQTQDHADEMRCLGGRDVNFRTACSVLRIIVFQSFLVCMIVRFYKQKFAISQG